MRGNGESFGVLIPMINDSLKPGRHIFFKSRFCASLLLYIVATAPPIWLLETKLCEWREDLAKDGKSDILIGRFKKKNLQQIFKH